MLEALEYRLIDELEADSRGFDIRRQLHVK
jgi:hypothetical protein